MGSFLLRRLWTGIPVLLGVSVLVFGMLHFLPGDPVMMMLTQPGGQARPMLASEVSDDLYKRMQQQLGLDRPLHEQFLNFLGRAVRGDLGSSFRSDLPVAQTIARNLPFTLELAAAALSVSIAAGVLFGTLAALRHRTWADTALMAVAVSGVSMPSFWLGLMLLLVFALELRWFPVVATQGWRALVLPAAALGFRAAAIIARLVRSSLIETLHQDYVRTARAKGLPGTGVVLRHALRNSLIPVATVVGLQFGNLLGGAVIVESVFGRPGIGQLAVQAILEKDFPVVQGVVLLTAVTYVIVNLLIDISYGWLDPRVRYR
ncbi:MAG: ABC transporter permease [Armatimonadetes bacterium]|nr:ABC transporter permease [Armatimonadota bacterium]